MNDEKFHKLLEKIQEMKSNKTIDLSMEEDLSVAVMNLVSLEEHFFFTANKTAKDSYFDLLSEVREVRKELLGRLIDKHEGETWCICKHLLAASMRLIEVGTKLYSDGKKEQAKQTFGQAYRVYSLFWGLRLKLIETGDIKKIDDDQLNKHDKSGGGQPWSMEDIVNKLVDCCNE
ncbi:MAG: hypothetical protein Q8N81_02185 [bacterium]|nr:hypothetical protein [bacterium]